MAEQRDYLVPDYYPDFACKMGACRHACCVGWPVSISVDDYFKLLGADCSPALRSVMDVAVKVQLHPTPDRYAQIGKDFFGNCRLRAEDGKCALQVEMGEEYLPQICRQYPRGVRTEGSLRCSCTNSCEATVELLLHRTEPLHFRYLPLVLPTQAEEKDSDVLRQREAEGLTLVKLLQDRSRPLADRLLDLCERLGAFEEEGSPVSFEEAIRQSFGIMKELSERSDAIMAYGQESARLYADGSFTFAGYGKARQDFEERFPAWETVFEHLLVNHMFFCMFPYGSDRAPRGDMALGLCSVYMLLRMLCLGCVTDETTEDQLVDLLSDAFRFVDHTDYYYFSNLALRDCGCRSRQALEAQMRL